MKLNEAHFRLSILHFEIGYQILYKNTFVRKQSKKNRDLIFRFHEKMLKITKCQFDLGKI